MDRLDINLSERAESDHGYNARWVEVDLIVNDKSLAQVLKDHEAGRGYEPAGGYGSISLDGLQPARDRLLGSPERWAGDGETVLLVCGDCREEGCWPMYCHIELGPSTVTWSSFRQPHRDDRDYGDLRFVFDRSAYIAAVASALPSND